MESIVRMNDIYFYDLNSIPFVTQIIYKKLFILFEDVITGKVSHVDLAKTGAYQVDIAGYMHKNKERSPQSSLPCVEVN